MRIEFGLPGKERFDGEPGAGDLPGRFVTSTAVISRSRTRRTSSTAPRVQISSSVDGRCSFVAAAGPSMGVVEVSAAFAFSRFISAPLTERKKKSEELYDPRQLAWLIAASGAPEAFSTCSAASLAALGSHDRTKVSSHGLQKKREYSRIGPESARF